MEESKDKQKSESDNKAAIEISVIIICKLANTICKQIWSSYKENKKNLYP